MQAYKKRFIQDIIEKNRRQFRIPVYQRNYDWKVSNCEKLFEDIVQCYEKSKSHFIGSIVYMQYNYNSSLDDCLVIDGQQRITSTMLLLKALYDVADEMNDMKIKTRIEDYLFNRNCEESFRLKLKPIKNDDMQFNLLMNSDFERMSIESNIFINYSYFLKKINKKISEGMQLINFIEGMEKIEIVEIILNSGDDDPQLIFESINSTGVDLTQSDLIRNYLLMNTESSKEQERLYIDYWLVMEEKLGNSNLEKYFYDFLIMKTKNYIKSDNIYNTFKIYFEDNNFTKEEILSELRKFSKYYQLLLGNKTNNYSYETKNICHTYHILNHNTIFSFLLNVCRDFDEEIITEIEFNKVLKLFSNYALRRLITGVPSSSLRRFYSTLYFRIFKNNSNKNRYYDAIESYLCQIKTNDVFPTDINFKNHLLTENVYKKGALTKYLLEIIENSNNKEKVDFRDLSIEHIMPQTLNDSWKKMLGEDYEIVHEELLHTLGNLSITGYNSKYSNSAFKYKKEMMNEVSTRILNLNNEIFNNDYGTET